jgi:predicted MFS family arabinose efflux permease
MLMPSVVGIVLSVGVAVFGRLVGFDRDRAFYPTLMIVIAAYYVLFAAMSGSVQTVLVESIVMTGFATEYMDSRCCTGRPRCV